MWKRYTAHNEEADAKFSVPIDILTDGQLTMIDELIAAAVDRTKVRFVMHPDRSVEFENALLQNKELGAFPVEVLDFVADYSGNVLIGVPTLIDDLHEVDPLGVPGANQYRQIEMVLADHNIIIVKESFPNQYLSAANAPGVSTYTAIHVYDMKSKVVLDDLCGVHIGSVDY